MLKISEFSLSFGNHRILKNFQLELEPGCLGMLKGPNGSGKSSILNAVSGVIPEYFKATADGSISLFGTDLTQIPLKEKFRYLWYSPSSNLAPFFFPSCEAELAFALENLGLASCHIRQRIDDALRRFGLPDELQQPPSTLSAGQQSLLQCAMAEALAPSLYLLDEPSRGLSDSSLDLLCQWLKDLKARSSIVLCAEHHPRLLAMADRIFETNIPAKYDPH